jgi:hypothetical protein
VAGNYVDGFSYQPIGYLYADGVTTPMTPPGVSVGGLAWLTQDTGSSTAYGINNHGDVVGWYSPSVQSGLTGGGYLYHDGQYTTYANFVPFAINDKGQELGVYGGGLRYSYTDDSYYHRNAGSSMAILDKGQLTPPNDEDANQVWHGFIATPSTGNSAGKAGPAITPTSRNGAASLPPGPVTSNGKLSGEPVSSALPAPVTIGPSPGTDAAAPTVRAEAVAAKPAAEAFSAFSATVVGDPSAVPSSSTASKDALFAGSAHGGLLSDLDASLSQDPYAGGHQPMSA